MYVGQVGNYFGCQNLRIFFDLIKLDDQIRIQSERLALYREDSLYQTLNEIFMTFKMPIGLMN